MRVCEYARAGGYEMNKNGRKNWEEEAKDAGPGCGAVRYGGGNEGEREVTQDDTGPAEREGKKACPEEGQGAKFCAGKDGKRGDSPTHPKRPDQDPVSRRPNERSAGRRAGRRIQHPMQRRLLRWQYCASSSLFFALTQLEPSIRRADLNARSSNRPVYPTWKSPGGACARNHADPTQRVRAPSSPARAGTSPPPARHTSNAEAPPPPEARKVGIAPCPASTRAPRAQMNARMGRIRNGEQDDPTEIVWGRRKGSYAKVGVECEAEGW
ncbi:hypothetical protein C8J57DRAFT_1232484 [Mycena rebaudengoi]|nr:hypothetical protein C8J57DRAFT_1232484 [Mycena rebaudengoi]